jgi:hypothetical protein
MGNLLKEYRAEIIEKWNKNPKESRGIYPPDYIDLMIEQANYVATAWLKANGMPAQIIDLVESVYTLQLEYIHGLAGKMDGDPLTGNARCISDLIQAIIQDIGELGASFDDPVELTPNMPAEWHKEKISDAIPEKTA